MRKKQRRQATLAAVIQDGHVDAADVPSEVLHGLSTEADIDILREPGTMPVTQAEVRASVGTEREGWRQAIEEAYIKNFAQRNVYTPATEAEKRQHGLHYP